ncbi:DUF1266 domain-containing protein [Curtobacterium sp. Csp2]|uniref:DUF1266 domain-containing protein n=1 Tax=Curtobacterium sp. Csp2 TaxID=2495430 RepID=UPI001580B90E|nr:DUF1266 domain-containing protein [Curtobacterium sp. Csp2]QKS17250.1 DUF1266 domain-containing protein [Curtobacterium sp. Csp2]
MGEVLQNHPGDREFPVRGRWRHRAMVAKARRQTGRRRDRAAAWIIMALAIVAFFVALVASTAGPYDVRQHFGYGFQAVWRCFLIAFVVWFVLTFVTSLRDLTLPVREQRRYRALARTPELPEHRLQQLALASFGDFSDGWWPASLAPYGSRTELGGQWLDDTTPSPFVTIPLPARPFLRQELDQTYKVASGRDAQTFALDLIGPKSISWQFAALARSPEGDERLSRMSSLLGEDPWAARNLLEARDMRPAKLLWAMDVKNAVSMIRGAYCAGLLTSDEAWATIDIVSTVAFTVFDSWDDFFDDLRAGYALVYDDLKTIQEFDRLRAELARSNWPVTRLPFPATPHAPLPRTVVEPLAAAEDDTGRS